MLADFFKALLQAYLAPQASVRAILSARPGFDTALWLVALSYLLTNIVLILTPGIDYSAAGGFVGRHFLGIVSTLISFFAISALVHFFGRVSGGTGTRTQIYVVIAWHSVVTAILSPPINLMMAGFRVEERGEQAVVTQVPTEASVALAVAALVIWCWLLAHFITAAHGFRNFWGVLAVVMGLPIGLGFMALNLISALSVMSANGLAQ